MKKYLKILFIFVLSFIYLSNVNAETGYVTDKSGVNMRDKPSTKDSEVLIEIPYNVEFYISNTEIEKGNGCSNNWYHIYYNNNYGYVCSNLVKILGVTETSYNRPWTSPKKAILGGAEYISKGYIAKGQFTSYLKKFNVNPNGYYPVYNHQYMANLRAPASEAYTTYKSLKSNGLLDNPINFVIPIFDNMPETTYDKNIKNTEVETSEEIDKAFEKTIKDFDESYKPYLRYLHTVHPTWTFTPLNTGLDFETSYLSEKAVSSIEISSNLCEDDPYYVTEKGWCIGNERATKFFLDPRNFLSEKYIFMFENLSYSETYNEEVVSSVLKNTFMEDLSILDNEKYSTIFVESGKKYNISPLYLASLARQESGTKVTSTTSGKEFTYEGYTYKGVYNFFNIGAYSSESNPAKAGLVWANGGKGANGAIKVEEIEVPKEEPKEEDKKEDNNKEEIKDELPKEEIKPVKLDETTINNKFISMLKAGTTVGNYLRGYDLGTKVKNVKSTVGNEAKVVIKDSNGNEKKDKDIIGTGNIIEISNEIGSKSYTYVMYGDLSGDGEINSADLLKMRQHLLGQINLTGAYLTSAYISGDNELNSADILRLRQHLLGTSILKQ